MITEFSVTNYKSLQSLQMELGRITVLIGANGAGKSNILEALAFASAAANDKLDNEFLATRGIRVTDDPRLMRSAFNSEGSDGHILINVSSDQDNQNFYELTRDSSGSYGFWKNVDVDLDDFIEVQDLQFSLSEMIQEWVRKKTESGKALGKLPKRITNVLKEIDEATASILALTNPLDLQKFLIYSPEYSTLRIFQEEGQILPLGIRGEGLLRLLRSMASEQPESLKILKRCMECLEWFSDIEVPSDFSSGERTLRIKDRYLDADLAYFNQRSANEGFLFLLFYFCLFLSDDTPPFFAVDNIDASLNPKLSRELVKTLARLAKENDKQAIFTTHNPAILDGLDLNDDEQRLFVVQRNRQGHTQVKRIMPPKVEEGQTPVRLSEAFLRGYIGGLPKNF